MEPGGEQRLQKLEMAGVSRAVVEALRNYVERGHRPGGFLCAVLRNDLVDAVCRADPDNFGGLKQIVLWIYNDAPAKCWGTGLKVEAWIKKHAAEARP